MKQAVVILAEGFEEIEALTVVDVLRRAGADCRMAGLEKKRVVGAHGIAVEADCLFADCAGVYDLVVLPGGMPGASHLAAHGGVRSLLTRQNERGGLIGAICAAPIALAAAGILRGRRATAYPGFEAELSEAELQSCPLVTDGNLITAQGPAFALRFALALAHALGLDAEGVSRGMLIPGQIS